MNRNLNELLRWSIENSGTAQNGTNGTTPAVSSGPADPALLEALFGGMPSEAELMRENMATATHPETTLENRLIALDNLEQLVESLDNANNLAPLGLWPPLLDLLAHSEHEVRKMAAWCVGTAVQNNERAQRELLERGGIERLVCMALGERWPAGIPNGASEQREGAAATEADSESAGPGTANRDSEHPEVRRKAAYALGSAVRNFQPAMDVASEELGRRGVSHAHGGGGRGTVDAGDMDQVDAIINRLKEEADAALRLLSAV